MSNNHIAVAFMNGIGNFILFTSAVKILKSWRYNKISLVTDSRFLKNPALMELSEGLFESIETEYDASRYEQLLIAGWSQPWSIDQSAFKGSWKYGLIRNVSFRLRGLHEVQVYLNMIGASWQDFDGYILDPADEPILRSDRPRIALANPEGSAQAKRKRWDKFPELSKILDRLGYTVVLLGQGGELDGCEGINFVGKLTLKQSAKVLQQCDLLITPSTCLAVVADAVKTPILQLEGPVLGTKTHPLLTSYAVVRKYISCAPCLQTGLMKMCQDPLCMSRIDVENVLQKMFLFLGRKHEANHIKIYAPSSDGRHIEPLTCKAKVAYLIPCYNRCHILHDFLTSFRDSHLQEGSILFLNDASVDPRVEELLRSFEIPDIDIKVHYYETPVKEKESLLRKYKKAPSAHAYNRLLKEVLTLDTQEHFDYVSIIDPDAIFKPFWCQKIIKVYQEAKKKHQIGIMSGFNFDAHPRYDFPGSEKVFETSAGLYRIRHGANLHYMMEMKFLKNHYGFYELTGDFTVSSDISKNIELTSMGFKAMVVVPSVMQQLGAFGSSFPRHKSNEIVWDF